MHRSPLVPQDFSPQREPSRTVTQSAPLNLIPDGLSPAIDSNQGQSTDRQESGTVNRVTNWFRSAFVGDQRATMHRSPLVPQDFSPQREPSRTATQSCRLSPSPIPPTSKLSWSQPAAHCKSHTPSALPRCRLCRLFCLAGYCERHFIEFCLLISNEASAKT